MTNEWLRQPTNVDARSIVFPPLKYDAEEGRVIAALYFDGAVREAIEVRRGIEDAAVLEAVVAELERRGYTVTPPPPPDPANDWREPCDLSCKRHRDRLALCSCDCPLHDQAAKTAEATDRWNAHVVAGAGT